MPRSQFQCAFSRAFAVRAGHLLNYLSVFSLNRVLYCVQLFEFVQIAFVVCFRPRCDRIKVLRRFVAECAQDIEKLM